MTRDLEADLMNSEVIRRKVADESYAQKLYAAMCNIQWYIDDPKDCWSCTWRYSGEVVANLRDSNEDYLDFYCSGIGGGVSEGNVDPEIEKDLADLGWKWKTYDPR